MKGIHVNRWNKGLDRDSSKRGYPSQAYYDGSNIRIVGGDSELDQGAVHTMKGNDIVTSLPSSYSDHSIIGWGRVGKWMVFFSTKNEGEDLEGDSVYFGEKVYYYINRQEEIYAIRFDYGQDMSSILTKGWSYYVENYTGTNERLKVEYFGDTTVTFSPVSTRHPDLVVSQAFKDGDSYRLFVPSAFDDVIWKLDTTLASPSPEKVYEGPLKLTKSYPIYNEVVGYYMNEDVQKIYWTDNYNYVRNVNIVSDSVDSLSPGKFDLIPDVDMSRPYLFGISGGSLPVGVVQYAYQLYRNDGTITTFSPASGAVHLTKSSESELDDRNYEGADAIDEDGNVNISGKAVTVEIENIDLTYDNIRVVSILYSQIEGEPSINIVADYPVGQSTMRVTDNGDTNQGSISLNMFRSLSGSLFKAKTIADKDNILFAGNTEGSYFDVDDLHDSGYWDARAYRFRSDGICKLYTNANTTDHTKWSQEYYSENFDSLDEFYNAIDQKADVANIANAPNRDMDSYIDQYFNDGSFSGYSCFYQSDGVTRGGEGPNISYELISGFGDIYTNTKFGSNKPYYYSEKGGINQSKYDYNSYMSMASPLATGLFKGFKSDEIYSFGIQFFNDKKQQSFVKWIGDIRFPRRLEESMAYESTSGTYLFPMGIKFNVDTSDLPPEVSYFRIVRCKREPSDRTIISQGLAFFPMIYTNSDPNTLRPHWYPTGDNDSGQLSVYIDSLEKSVFLFQSPDLYYGNTIEEVDWTVQVGRLASTKIYNRLSSDSEWKTYSKVGDLPVADSREFLVVKYSDCETINSVEATSVSQQTVVSPSDTSDQVDIGDSLNYVNWFETNDSGGGNFGPHATTLTLKLNSPQSDIGGDTEDTVLVDLKKSRIPYKGYGYYDRLQREYIPCSDMKLITGGVVDVETFEGDTFIDYTEHIKNMYNKEDKGEPNHTRILYPVEASINPKLVDRTYSINQKNTQVYQQIQEKAGVYDYWGGATLTQNKDFYRYNMVYSKQPDAEIAIPKPDRGFYTTNRSLVKASNVKSRFTTADEWTNFASGNELNLESKHGDLNKILTIGNSVLFLQENGFGTLSVNERALTQTTDDVQLVLGGSGVLSRYDYISRNLGLQHKDAVVRNDYGLFWYDQNRKKFWGYQDGIKDLTQSAGMNNYFAGLSDYDDNMFTGSGIIMGDNINNNEIWLTFYDGNYTTLVYSYMLGKFSSFIDNNPLLYIEDSKGLYDIYNANTLYKYDQDTYTFYGNDFTPYITFIVAPMQTQNSFVRTAKYDVISWLSEKYSSGTQQHDSTINTIRFENSHQQDSGERTLVPYSNGVSDYNTRKFNGLWRYNTIRDGSGYRMADYYLKVTMKWDNDRFVLYEVQTYYRSAD